MNKKDILKNVYDDFFGISKKKEEEELNRQIKESLDADTIEINIPQEKEKVSNIDGDKMLKQSFERIDKLYIDEKLAAMPERDLCDTTHYKIYKKQKNELF